MAGRPKKAEREHRVNVRFPESKYRELQQMALEMGLDCTALCRMAAYEFLKKAA